jgi:hypothetical protein
LTSALASAATPPGVSAAPRGIGALTAVTTSESGDGVPDPPVQIAPIPVLIAEGRHARRTTRSDRLRPRLAIIRHSRRVRSAEGNR